MRTRQQNRLFPLYSELEEAVRVAGITTKAAYDDKKADDPRLSSRPDVQYKDRGWKSWTALFGTEDVPATIRYGSKRAR